MRSNRDRPIHLAGNGPKYSRSPLYEGTGPEAGPGNDQALRRPVILFSMYLPHVQYTFS